MLLLITYVVPLSVALIVTPEALFPATAPLAAKPAKSAVLTPATPTNNHLPIGILSFVIRGISTNAFAWIAGGSLNGLALDPLNARTVVTPTDPTGTTNQPEDSRS